MTIEVGGGSSAGGTLGDIVTFSSKAAMAASGNFVPCDGSINLWSDYTSYAAAVDNIPPCIRMVQLSNTASEAGNNVEGAFGGFKSFATAVWAFPSKTAQLLTVVRNTLWSGVASADQSIITNGIPFQVQYRDANDGEGVLVTTLTANSIVDYSLSSNLSSWSTVDLNGLVSLTASSRAIGCCNSGASGRWYTLWSNSTTLQIAYSGVDTVNTGWTLWGGTVTSGSSAISAGSIAVKEGSAWIWSSIGGVTEIIGKIYGATSLGGTPSLLLDISPTLRMYFHLSYDVDEDIFIALPSIKGYPIYTSADSGATWDIGDVVPLNPQHRAVKYDTTENIYIVSYTNTGSSDLLFHGIKRDSNGCMRLIQVQQKDGVPGEYFQNLVNNFSNMIVANPDTSLAICQVNGTSAYDLRIDANLTTEFTTINLFNTTGVFAGASEAMPIGTYYGLRVK